MSTTAASSPAPRPLKSVALPYDIAALLKDVAAHSEAQGRALQPAAEARHTPTPWHVDNCPSGFIYINAGSARVARIEDQKYMTEAHAQADAEFAVAAVNAHAGFVARVAELETALRHFETCAADGNASDAIAVLPELESAFDMMRAALAQEGGK